MIRRHDMGFCWIGLFLLTAAFIGCSTGLRPGISGTQPVNADQVITNLTPDIERLYLSWYQLDQIYQDIKFLERGFLFDPDDRQLGYIQKASLYVQDAAVRIHHQWEQLAVLHYIRPEMMRDYLTLSVKGLTSVIKEIGYDEKFLEIYGAYIDHAAVTGDLNRARASIKENLGVLNQLLASLLPLANATVPPTAL